MISQESISMDAGLSDFSAALQRANNKDMYSKSSFDRSVNTPSYGYNSSGNRNLSSVLSQIQDEGPAYGDTSKRDNLVNLMTNKKHRSETSSADQHEPELNQAELNQSSIKDYSTDELLRKDILSGDAKNGRLINSLWPQMVLVLLVATVSVASLFMIYTKNNDMETILNLYDARIKDGAASKNNGLSPEITSINETLKLVQQELHIIKTEYPASLTSRTLAQSNETVIIKDNVSELENEILALKKELKAVNSKLKTIDRDKSQNSKAAVTKHDNPNLDGLVVNLASFANKKSAEKIAEQLSEAGLSASLQQAVVSGSQIYRLSVGGFKKRSEAEIFIREAGKKYGMKQGWIRKS